MKNLLFYLLFSLISLAGFSQLNVPSTVMTGAGGAVDSANTRYLKAKVTTSGGLSVQSVAIKISNTGTTLAGYQILQYSLNDTDYQNCPTWKQVAYGSVPQAAVRTIDTFTLANQTTRQSKLWEISGQSHMDHPAPYFRVASYGTTSKWSTWGFWWLWRD